MHKRLIFCSMLIFSIFSGISIVMGQYETLQPTEELTPLVPSPTIELTPPQYYPEYLMCEEVEHREGSSWLDIEVGVSSLDDLMMTLDGLGEYEVLLINDAYIYLGRIEDEGESLEVDPLIAPSYVALCISDDSIITSLAILSRRGFQLDIYDLIATYGIPDAITYMARPLSRIAFWFDVGVATTVDVIQTEQAPYRVTAVYYFPFVDATSFESEYPYIFTREEALSSVEQNPFDFDAMIATITTEASRTPTPTITPRATTESP